MSSTAHDLARGWRLPADIVPLELTGHALHRWTQRVAAMEAAEVETEVARLLASATVSRTPPDWASEVREHTFADAWLSFDDKAVLPLHRVGEGPDERWRAATVITRDTAVTRAIEMLGDGLRISTVGPRTQADRNAVEGARRGGSGCAIRPPEAVLRRLAASVEPKVSAAHSRTADTERSSLYP
jgi:hypothetical protein